MVEKPRRLSDFCIELLFVLTLFLLPVKWGCLAGIVEAENSIWSMGLPGWVFGTWTVSIFGFWGCFLAFVSLLHTRGKQMNRQGWVWLFLGLVSLLGIINASCFDYVINYVGYILGCGGMVFAFLMIYQTRKYFERPLLIAMGIGFLWTLYSAYYQYSVGFENMQQYLTELYNEGINYMQGALSGRLNDNRIYSTFTVSNTFACYLVMVIPLMTWFAWRLGRRVDPPQIASPLLGLFVLLPSIFILWHTQSRGGYVAMVLSTGIALWWISKGWIRWVSLGAALLAFVSLFSTLIYLSTLSRGMASAWLRIDYSMVALKLLGDNFLCGTGWGDFGNGYLLYKWWWAPDSVMCNLNEGAKAAHSLVFDLGSSCGIGGFLIGLLILSSPFIFGFYQLKKFNQKGRKALLNWRFFAFWGMIAFVIHSFLEMSLQTPANLAFFGILSILAVGRNGFAKVREESKVRHFSVVLLALTVVGLGFYFSYLSIKQDYYLGELITSVKKEREGWMKMRVGKENPSMLPLYEKQVKYAFNCTQKEIIYSPFPWMEMAKHVQLKNDYKKMVFYYHKAIEICPERSSFWFCLGMATKFSGDESKGAEYIKKSFSLFPYAVDNRKQAEIVFGPRILEGLPKIPDHLKISESK